MIPFRILPVDNPLLTGTFNMYKCCQNKYSLTSVTDGPKKLPVKSSENWANNHWDIADVDKCHQDKFFLDKCYPDIWQMYLLRYCWYWVAVVVVGGRWRMHFCCKSNLGWFGVLAISDETKIRLNSCITTCFELTACDRANLGQGYRVIQARMVLHVTLWRIF